MSFAKRWKSVATKPRIELAGKRRLGPPALAARTAGVACRDEVYGWLLALTESGPPDGALSAPWDDDLLVAAIPSARLSVTLLAIGHDRLIIVKEFDDL